VAEVGFQVGGIAVVVDGVPAVTNSSLFRPTDPPTLRLRAVVHDGPLRPSLPLRVERDSWAGFSDGDRIAITSRRPNREPCEVARIELAADALDGTIYHLPDEPIRGVYFPIDQLLLMHALALRSGLLMHGAIIAGPAGGFLVVGPSGAGKTTMARAAAALPGARVLSDERAVVRRDGDGWVLDGTPWYGEGQFAERATVPLLGLVWLVKSERDSLEPLRPARALANLYSCHFAPLWCDALALRCLDTLEQLVRSVPAFCLHNRRGGDGARLLLARAGA
jgi:hypothetical protein